MNLPKLLHLLRQFKGANPLFVTTSPLDGSGLGGGGTPSPCFGSRQCEITPHIVPSWRARPLGTHTKSRLTVCPWTMLLVFRLFVFYVRYSKIA